MSNSKNGIIVSIRTPGQRGQGNILGHFTDQAQADLALAHAKKEGLTEGKDVLTREYEPSQPQSFADWLKDEQAVSVKAAAIDDLATSDPETYAKLVAAGVIRVKKAKA